MQRLADEISAWVMALMHSIIENEWGRRQEIRQAGDRKYAANPHLYSIANIAVIRQLETKNHVSVRFSIRSLFDGLARDTTTHCFFLLQYLTTPGRTALYKPTKPAVFLTIGAETKMETLAVVWGD